MTKEDVVEMFETSHTLSDKYKQLNEELYIYHMWLGLKASSLLPIEISRFKPSTGEWLD